MHSPAVSVAEIDDPAVAGAGIDVLDMDAVQLESVPLRGRRIVVRLASGAVVYHRTNARMRTRTVIGPDLVACMVAGPRAPGTVNGWSLAPDTMLVAGAGVEASVFAEAGWDSVSFVLPARDLQEGLVARGTGVPAPTGAVDALRVGTAKARELYHRGVRLAESAARHPAGFEVPSAQREALGAELMELLLAAVKESAKREPTREERKRQVHIRILKAAEDHVLARAQHRVHVSDVCRAAGVSERTLEYAIKDLTGLTPVGYLARLRLHRVRQGLLAASGSSSTVAAEALDWGFGHFGEFARTYRACFGERPSDTLRRAPAAALAVPTTRTT